MSTKYCGYCGKVLKVNLTDRSVSEYPFSDKDREKYLGGKIMAAKIIADHIKGKIDAYESFVRYSFIRLGRD